MAITTHIKKKMHLSFIDKTDTIMNTENTTVIKITDIQVHKLKVTSNIIISVTENRLIFQAAEETTLEVVIQELGLEAVIQELEERAVQKR